ncbi:hypothetical protein Gotur_020179, partial [Gossypium turneri]
MVLHTMFLVLSMPYPRYGLTWEFSYRCPYHVPDMVLRRTSHLGANTMSQTWSYTGPLIISMMPMPCPKHGLTWDLFTKCHDICIQYIHYVSTGLFN